MSSLRLPSLRRASIGATRQARAGCSRQLPVPAGPRRDGRRSASPPREGPAGRQAATPPTRGQPQPGSLPKRVRSVAPNDPHRERLGGAVSPLGLALVRVLGLVLLLPVRRPLDLLDLRAACDRDLGGLFELGAVLGEEFGGHREVLGGAEVPGGW